LVGVLCEPRHAADVQPALPAVLMLNAGILHHVGPSRLHVTLARTLAHDGFTSLRFDFSGVGDSEPRQDCLSFDQAAVLEVADAMDCLVERRGIDEFVLFGVCSGADVAFRAARSDTRVVGFVAVDGYAYRNVWYYLHHYAPRLLQPSHWKKFTLRQLRKTLRAVGLGRLAGSNGGPWSTFRRTFPPKEDVERDLRLLVGRGVEQLHIYSAGQEEHYNYRKQFRDNFRSVDFRGRVRSEYLAAADHTFTALDQQRLLVNTVSEWMNQVWHPTTREASPGTRSEA
jgi:pimeloyl-ACP methyl ester carboxylesterase